MSVHKQQSLPPTMDSLLNTMHSAAKIEDELK